MEASYNFDHAKVHISLRLNTHIMHELSAAQSIIDAVLFEAEKNGASHVKEINVDVGELKQLDTRALSESLKILTNVDKLRGAKIRIRVERAHFSCRKCQNQWDLKEARKQLEIVPDSLSIRGADSKQARPHFLPQLDQSFIHCTRCGSDDVATSDGEDIKLRNLVME